MSTDTKKKPTVKALRAELAALREQLAEVTQQAAEKEAELAAFRSAEQKHSEELMALQAQLRTATDVLVPLFKKTKEWADQWPPAATPLWQKLTWGELKAAADVGRDYAK